MEFFEVVYLARPHGSIGRFQHVPITVQANSINGACKEAFELLQERYETNHPISCTGNRETLTGNALRLELSRSRGLD